MRTTTACLALLWPCFAFAQQEIKLNASDAAASDEFSSSVAVSGNVLIAGAPKNNDQAIGCGTAYIFRQNGANWIQEQELTALDAGVDDQFGISVDIHDNVAIVGAHYDDDNGTNAGAAYIYRHNGSIWVQQDKLIALDGAAGDEFGHSVSIYDSIAVVGAYRANMGSTGNGAVYVFKYNGTNWIQIQKLNGISPQIDDFFGHSVDIHKDRIITGAYQDDDAGVNSGSAYIFNFNGSLWQQEQKIIAANAASGDLFGFSVSINDSTAIMGAYGKNGTFSASGSAYVYKRSGSIWSLDQQLTAADGLQDDWFGYDVSISGKTILVGAFHDDDLGSESGSVYLFRWDNNNWNYEFTLRASDGTTNDFFGITADIDANLIAVGMPNSDDNGSNSGSTYVYDLCTYRPIQELCLSSVNTNFNENILIWEKSATTFIDSFFVYRDHGSGMTRIGQTNFASAGEFIDNAANINGQSYQYLLTTSNHCGVEGPMGSIHKTIHLVASPAGPGQVQLNWDDQQGFSFPYYRIWRDTTGTGAYHLLFATLNSQFTFTDNSLPLGVNLDYYIEVLSNTGACNSVSTSRNYAWSNRSNPYTSSSPEEEKNLVSIFPNPANDRIIIASSVWNQQSSMDYQLIENSGKVIRTGKINSVSTQIPVSELANGSYVLLLQGADFRTAIPVMILR